MQVPEVRVKAAKPQFGYSEFPLALNLRGLAVARYQPGTSTGALPVVPLTQSCCHGDDTSRHCSDTAAQALTTLPDQAWSVQVAITIN